MKYFYISMWVVVLGISLLAPNLVQKASAISDSLVIYQVQTGASTNASEEIILLYNSSLMPVNVTDWCLFYSSASNLTFRNLACIDAPIQTEIWLESKAIVSFASSEFVTVNPEFMPDYLFSSGLLSMGGHVWIEDTNNNKIDKLGWGTALLPEALAVSPHTSGKVISRNNDNILIDSDSNIIDFSSQFLISPIISGLYEQTAIIDLCLNISDIQVDLPDGFLQDDAGDCYADICPNIANLQTVVPVGFEKLENENTCSEIMLETATILITELLPNTTSVDTGKEFIELYNPNSFEVNLLGYSIQIGPSFTKKYTIGDVKLGAGKYIVFSDSQSLIILPNSTGAQLKLVAPAGNIVAETASYNNAGDDLSWALVEDQWIYTNQPSPGSINQPYVERAVDEEINITTVLAPCPIGKYRNPETNRCRNIETAVSTLTQCDEDEYRNTETNRCRKLATASSTLVACKAGQVRNPDTNRCRNIATGSTLATCTEGQERNPETNRCRKVSAHGASIDDIPTVTDVSVENSTGQANWLLIALALLGTAGYMAYEWRVELAHSFGRIRQQRVQ